MGCAGVLACAVCAFNSQVNLTCTVLDEVLNSFSFESVVKCLFMPVKFLF